MVRPQQQYTIVQTIRDAAATLMLQRQNCCFNVHCCNVEITTPNSSRLHNVDIATSNL